MENRCPGRVPPHAGRLRGRERARSGNRLPGRRAERARAGEPTLLADKLRAAVPIGGSAVVLAAEASVVDEMLSAFDVDDAQVTRRTLSEDEVAVTEVALSDEAAAPSSN